MKKFLLSDVQQGRLNKIMTLQRQNDIIAMLLEGRDTKEIKTYLINKYRVSPNTANFYVSQGRDLIKKRKNYEIENLLSMHIERYEDIYTKLLDLGAYSMAANALKAKEKLLHFHRPGFHMKVTQGQIQQLSLRNVSDEYDLSKLPENKKQRFDQLVQKTKMKQNGNSDTI